MESVVKTYDNTSPEERARIAIEECKYIQSLIIIIMFLCDIEKDRNLDEEDNDNDIMSHLNYRKL